MKSLTLLSTYHLSAGRGEKTGAQVCPGPTWTLPLGSLDPCHQKLRAGWGGVVEGGALPGGFHEGSISIFPLRQVTESVSETGLASLPPGEYSADLGGRAGEPGGGVQPLRSLRSPRSRSGSPAGLTQEPWKLYFYPDAQ